MAASYDTMNAWDLVVGRNQILPSILKFIVISCISFVVIHFIYVGIDKLRETKKEPGKVTTFLFEKKVGISSFIIMVLCWLPNYSLYFPGVMTYDAVRQYEEFFSGNMTNHHPVVTTLLEGGFVKLGRVLGNQSIGIAVYLAIVLVLTAVIISFGFVWMKQRNISYVCRWMMLGFFSLFPIWSAYARTVVKDSLFYPVFFLFILAFFRWVLNAKDELNARYTIRFLLAGILLSLVRHNGWYVMLGTLFFMIFWNRKRRKQMVVAFVGFLLLFKGYTGVLLPACGVMPGGSEEMLSIPFQQTARYVKYHDSEVTKQEREAINNVLNYSVLADKYDPNISDPIKVTYKHEDAYLGAYFKVWFQQLKKHPTTYIQATLNGTYGYVGYKKNIKYPIGYYSQLDWLKTYHDKYRLTWSESTEKLRESYTGMISKVFEDTPLKLLSQPMFYTWIFILLCGYSMLDRYLRRYWIIFIPVLVLFALCFASPVNGDLRYMLPIMSTMFLYVAFILRTEVNQ